jgi:signal transduction histidine kinase
VARLAELLLAFSHRADRERALERLARWLGSDRVYIFVPDVETGTLSSVTRFDQRTPHAREWYRRLAASLPETMDAISLPDPVTGQPASVILSRIRDGSVLAAVGPATEHARLRWAEQIVPLLTNIVHAEQTASTGRAQTAASRHLTDEARTLTERLEVTTRRLEEALAATATARRALADNEQRASLTVRVAEILADTPDLVVALHEIAALVVETCCDACVVHLVGDAGRPVEICGIQRLADGTIAALDRAAGGQLGEHPLTQPLRTRQVAIVEVQDPRLAERRMQFASAPILSARGTAFGTIAIGTIRRAAEAGCISLAQELARRTGAALDASRLHDDVLSASRLKDDFLATLSHELRTPLNAMLGWIQMLRLYREDESIRERAVDVIERNARTQAQLVADLLDVSRLITGKLRLRLARVDLRDIVIAGCESVRPSADAKGLHLVVETADVAGVTLGDADRLEQVLWNLLSNATKFTPPGGTVTVRLSSGDGYADIAVGDTGIGIRPEFLPHVFDRFRQSDSTTTRAHGGLGLGLALARHLVELHGGSVYATSEGEGRGATFGIRLPFRPVEDPAHVRAGPTEHRSAAAQERVKNSPTEATKS